MSEPTIHFLPLPLTGSTWVLGLRAALRVWPSPMWPGSSNEKELWRACAKGDVERVRGLLAKGDVDVNWVNKEYSWKSTPLHCASTWGHLQIVELLLQANANVAATDKNGRTPLHIASSRRNVQVVELLLHAKASIEARDLEGHGSFHLCLRSCCQLGLDHRLLTTLRALVAAGAVWDTTCEQVTPLSWQTTITPALRTCIQFWRQERDSGFLLTDVPNEVVERGCETTQAYIDGVKGSGETAIHVKLCLVGSSFSGKTSLVKSIISCSPQMMDPDDRSIGIDHYSMAMTSVDDVSKHELVFNVTFLDFAGEKVYHICHSLFFLRRAMYLVCIDLEAFTTAFLQASIMSYIPKKEEELLDEFIERTVVQWVRMILARQPLAEFVFIATKEDLITENTRTEKLFKDCLKTKLAKVDREIKVKRALQKSQVLASKTMADKISSEFESNEMGQVKPGDLMFSSCTSLGTVTIARERIESLIVASERNFWIPSTYSRVLEAIGDIKRSANNQSVTNRVEQMWTPVDSLIARLPGDSERCRVILQTLHDLGEIIWHEDPGEGMFRNTVILDPLLLIEFIRQVINHNHRGQTMLHENLMKLPYWMSLSSPKQLQAMKQLLQKFNLVYAANNDCDSMIISHIMRWDSDMIVPAYWQTKTSAACLWLGDILRINDTKSSMTEAVRVHWEFYFETGLPPSLFSHVIVASVSAFFKFDAGPDWIVSEEKGIAACRILVGRDEESLHRTIHVEAVVSEKATAKQTDELWAHFLHFCRAFFRVLKEYPGLAVSSTAWDHEHEKIGLRQVMQVTQHTASWLPPSDILEQLSHGWRMPLSLLPEGAGRMVPRKTTELANLRGDEDSAPHSLSLYTQGAPMKASTPKSTNMTGVRGDKNYTFPILSHELHNVPVTAIDHATISTATCKLLEASMSGNLIKLEKLIRTSEADIDWPDGQHYWRTALHHATSEGYYPIALLLLTHGACVNATDQNGCTPLHLAAGAGHDQIVKLLLEHSANIEATNENQHTPLHLATRSGHTNIVKLLLQYAANIEAITKTRSTPLHLAILEGHVEIAVLLLDSNCNPNPKNQSDETPLHVACRSCEDQIVVALLQSNAELHAVNKTKDEPLHVCLEENQIVDESTLRTLQVLATYGSVWDDKCDEMVASGKACAEASALRVCMLTWCKERENGAKYTQIPIEVINRGPASTQSYIDEIKASTRIEFRRKICVVGSSMAGKTSLIKSLMTKVPSLEHPKDRTIGIETSEFRFESTDEGESHFHVVAFWDFAGQNAYHVAHSLFFSRRTLFLVCVDLEAYVTAFMQADLMGNDNGARNQLMNEFIES